MLKSVLGMCRLYPAQTQHSTYPRIFGYFWLAHGKHSTYQKGHFWTSSTYPAHLAKIRVISYFFVKLFNIILVLKFFFFRFSDMC